MIPAAIKVECPPDFNNELIIEATEAIDDVGMMVREAAVRKRRLDLRPRCGALLWCSGRSPPSDTGPPVRRSGDRG
jgi:hypothetical protein